MKILNKTIFILSCFFTASASLAQWYTDPEQPRHCLDIGFSAYEICSDGSNGAYFSGLWQGYYGYLGHINSSGNLSYADITPSFPYLVSVDTSVAFLHTYITLVPSQPIGSVFVITQRAVYDPDSYPNPWLLRGYAIAEFNSTGLTDFGQININDTHHILHYKSDLEDWQEGRIDIHSDGQGGLHVVVDTVSNYWPPSKSYYNHLQSDGVWTHSWPGLPLLQGGNGYAISEEEDGFGGVMVFVKWSPSSPIFPNQITLQRFNNNGQQMLVSALPLARPELKWFNSSTLEPGRILIIKDSIIAEEPPTRTSYAFLLDTNGVNQWESQGRQITQDEGASYITSLRSDKQGGFFVSVFYRADSIWISHRYNWNAEHLCQTAPGYRILPILPDGLGGAYDVNMISVYPYTTPSFASVWRWRPDLQLAWPESTLVFYQSSGGIGQIWSISEDHAVIGAV